MAVIRTATLESALVNHVLAGKCGRWADTRHRSSVSGNPKRKENCSIPSHPSSRLEARDGPNDSALRHDTEKAMRDG